MKESDKERQEKNIQTDRLISQWHIQDKKLILSEGQAAKLGPEDIRIQVHAIGVNRADLLQVKGLYPAPFGFDSAVPGLEYAGKVIEIGTRVPGHYLHTSVMGLIPSGAYCEEIAVHHRESIFIPEGVSFAEAATLPEGYLTAYRALFLEGGLKPGHWAMIRPATAAVGMAAIQLCRAVGVRTIGTSRKAHPVIEDESFAPDYWVEEVKLVAQCQAIFDEGFCHSALSVVMDMVGPDWNEVIRALQPDGRLVSVGVLGGIESNLNLFQLLMKRIKIKAMTMRSQPLEQRIQMANYFNTELLPLFEQHKLKILPFKTFTFAQAPEAHADMLAGQWQGKRVIVLA